MEDFSQVTDTRSNASESWPASDTISILVATDNHLGYCEKDPVRGNDSLTTFEEILKIAVTEQVDMVLLGGDLFHDNKPSRHTLYQTMALLRQYCLGDRPCYLNFLSDQSINFQNMFATANYLDPNINVSLPVFSIHGNHDEPCGKGNLCPLDLLSVAGLVNYFGRSREIDNISLHPILLQKGATKLALYGLGNVRDERLHDTFLKGKVEVMRPREDADVWFNLLALHQNRVAHTKTSYIPEDFLESCFDLVVWGHEHECLIEPTLNANQGFYVTQPGSSIATSLMRGEAAKKHVAIVKINRTFFNLRKVPLKTVRPFIFRDFYLDGTLADMATLTNTLLNEVKSMIQEAEEELGDHDAPPKPLIRLRVELDPSIDTISPHRFIQHLVDKVANPRDAFQFRRPKQPIRRTRLTQLAANTFSQPQGTADSTRRIEDLILEAMQDYTPGIFPEKQMVEALQRAVEKDEKDVLEDFMKKHEGLALGHLHKNTTTDSIDELKDNAKQQTQLRRLDFNIEPTNLSPPNPVLSHRPPSPPKPAKSKRKAPARSSTPAAPVSATQRLLSRKLPEDNASADEEFCARPAAKASRVRRSKPIESPIETYDWDTADQLMRWDQPAPSQGSKLCETSFVPASPKLGPSNARELANSIGDNPFGSTAQTTSQRPGLRPSTRATRARFFLPRKASRDRDTSVDESDSEMF